jgi:hypothetical protein
MQFQFVILRPRAAQVTLQIDTISHLRHQRLFKPDSPIPVVMLRQQPNRVAARVGSVVESAIVVRRPVHESAAPVGG